MSRPELRPGVLAGGLYERTSGATGQPLGSYQRRAPEQTVLHELVRNIAPWRRLLGKREIERRVRSKRPLGHFPRRLDQRFRRSVCRTRRWR